MAREGLLAAAATDHQTSWSVVILAVLGSSAVGAIVGGLMTTSLRGRIERDAEWRTRLLDSAAALQTALSDCLLSHGTLVMCLRKAESPSEAELDDARTRWGLVRTNAGLVELLFTRQSATYVTTNDILLLLRDMRRAMNGVMDRMSLQTSRLGVTPESDQTEAVLTIWEDACARFDKFADAVNEHVRSAHLRNRARLRRV
jgi:hypothetical protein